MQTHQETIRKLEARGLHTMKQETANQIFLSLCKTMGFNPGQLSFEGDVTVPKDTKPISDYIARRHRGLR